MNKDKFREKLKDVKFRKMVIKETIDYIVENVPVRKIMDQKYVTLDDKEEQALDSFLQVVKQTKEVDWLKESILNQFDFDDIMDVWRDYIEEMVDDGVSEAKHRENMRRGR